MNKIIGIIVAIAVIAAGVWYFTQNQGSSETKNDISSSQTESEVSVENTSLKQLMARGKDMKCTYTSTEEGAPSSGTIYVSKDKGRGDFTVREDGKTTTGHMIFDSTTSYIWMDGQTTGMKMAMNTSDAQANTSTQSVDPDKNYDYKCDSWRADASMFVPPSDVTFQEFKIPAVPASSSPSSMDAAAICNSLSEPAKTQCLASVNKQ